MPPTPVTSPTRRFVVTRIDAGVETNVIATTPLPANYTSDQVVRVCVACGCRHFELTVDPLKLSVREG